MYLMYGDGDHLDTMHKGRSKALSIEINKEMAGFESQQSISV